jgi:hypothetical protein
MAIGALTCRQPSSAADLLKRLADPVILYSHAALFALALTGQARVFRQHVASTSRPGKPAGAPDCAASDNFQHILRASSKTGIDIRPDHPLLCKCGLTVSFSPSFLF